LVTFVVFTIYGSCANLLQKHVAHSKGVISYVQKCFAVVFSLLAYKMANI